MAIVINPRLYIEQAESESAALDTRLYAQAGTAESFSIAPRLYLEQADSESATLDSRLYTDNAYSAAPFGDLVWKFFRGNGVAAALNRGPQYGASNNNNDPYAGTPNVTVRIYPASISGGTVTLDEDLLFTTYLNLHYDKEWGYKDGIDPRTGENPAVISLHRNLPAGYGWYYLEMENTGTVPLVLDDLWVFSYDINRPTATLRSDRHIMDLNSENSLDFQRNNVVVMGQRKGVWVGDREEDISNYDEKTHRNPVFTNYHSKAVDLDSIYNPASPNHVGRASTVYIQEPSISNYSRADWLSQNILAVLRKPRSLPETTLAGEPRNEIDDCVAITDLQGSSGKFWVNGMRESIAPGKWEVRLGVDSIPPWPSYQEFDPYDVADFDNNAIINVRVTDTDGYLRAGNSSTLSSTQDSSSTSITLADGSGFPSNGVLIVHEPASPVYGKFVYNRKSGANTFVGAFVLINKSGHTFSSGAVVTDAYNPYEADDAGTQILVSFDCLVHGRLQVGIKGAGVSAEIPRWAAGLTGGGGIEQGEPKSIRVAAGEHVELIWGGIDQTGVTHPDKLNDESNPLAGVGNFFAHDGGYYVQFDLEDLKTGATFSIKSTELNGEYNAAAAQPIEILRSGIDALAISYDYVNPLREDLPFMPADGDYYFLEQGTVTCYKNGSYSAVTAYDEDGEVESKNRLLFENEGGVDLVFTGNEIHGRYYRILASVEFITVEYPTGASQVHSESGKVFGWAEGDRETFTRTHPESGGLDLLGGFGRIGGEGRTINFDPETNFFGGDSFCEFVRQDAGDSSAVYQHAVRLVMEIVDKSGRPISPTSGENEYNTTVYAEEEMVAAEFWLMLNPGELQSPQNGISEGVYYFLAEPVQRSGNSYTFSHIAFEPGRGHLFGAIGGLPAFALPYPGILVQRSEA